MMVRLHAIGLDSEGTGSFEARGLDSGGTAGSSEARGLNLEAE